MAIHLDISLKHHSQYFLKPFHCHHLDDILRNHPWPIFSSILHAFHLELLLGNKQPEELELLMQLTDLLKLGVLLTVKLQEVENLLKKFGECDKLLNEQ